MKTRSKAETLAFLSDKLKHAQVLPLTCFDLKEWNSSENNILEEAQRILGANTLLIVRSSAVGEDGKVESFTGKYLSVPGVKFGESLRQAIRKVFESYRNNNPDNQVFLQPYIKFSGMSGVAFTREPSTGAPYYVINYDITGGTTSTVTSGHFNDTRVFYHFKSAPLPNDKRLRKLMELLKELETTLNSDSLDIEFAFDLKDKLYLLQARPLILLNKNCLSEEEIGKGLDRIQNHFDSFNRPLPYLFGENVIYGIMPDWNPAECIGVRPRPLALSLYKELITDKIWAYQRDNYGYRNLRSFPLLHSFCGLPYIDVRVSFNSFIPASVPPGLSEQLVTFYLDALKSSPKFHDKVEFNIIISCYTFDLQSRLEALRQHGFSEEDLDILENELRKLTNKVIGENGLWKADKNKIYVLEKKHKIIIESDLNQVSKIFWILEDCKRYGTLPFAGLARAGFIAVQLLQSMVNEKILSQEEYQRFMHTLQTIGHTITTDFKKLNKNEFLNKYGHLRPGTYDISSARYDQEPDRYFNWAEKIEPEINSDSFALSISQLKKVETYLKDHGLDLEVLEFFDFIRNGIEGREYAKFIFTRSLSSALEIFNSLAKENGFTRDEASYADISCIYKLHSSSEDISSVLADSIENGKKNYNLTRSLTLPPIIFNSESIWSFHLPENEPNFITLGRVSGRIALVDDKDANFQGKILFLPNADPGLDWIFSRGLGGFITMYGGANSHMAIRAIEQKIPAVIGVGEVMYQKWVEAQEIEIDCANKLVRVIK